MIHDNLVVAPVGNTLRNIPTCIAVGKDENIDHDSVARAQAPRGKCDRVLFSVREAWNNSESQVRARRAPCALRPEWSTWDLTKQLRRNMRFFWPRAESQIYGEAKSLVARGWARDRRNFTGERVRTSYAITAAGRRALHAWLETPPKPTSLQCEPLLRIFLADFVTSEQLGAALDQVRARVQAYGVGRWPADRWRAR